MPRDAFEELCRLARKEHDRLFASGSAPALDDLVGWDFEGWNASLLPRLGGFQKFLKGFQRPDGAPAGEAEGFNCPVIQNGLDGEWLGLPSDGQPRRFGFYRVTRSEGTIALDYGAHAANPRLDPSRLLRDFLVAVGESSDLLLGRAHLALPGRPLAGYFILHRRRRLDAESFDPFSAPADRRRQPGVSERRPRGGGADWER